MATRPQATCTFIEPATTVNRVSARPLPPVASRRIIAPPCSAVGSKVAARRVPRSSLPSEVLAEEDEDVYTARYAAPKSDVWLCSRPTGNARPRNAPVFTRSCSDSSDSSVEEKTYISSHCARNLRKSPSTQGLTTSE